MAVLAARCDPDGGMIGRCRVALFTGAQHIIVINGKRNPRRGHVTRFTAIRAVYVTSTFTRRRRTVMASDTRTLHLRVIDA